MSVRPQRTGWHTAQQPSLYLPFLDLPCEAGRDVDRGVVPGLTADSRRHCGKAMSFRQRLFACVLQLVPSGSAVLYGHATARRYILVRFHYTVKP